MGMKYSLKEKIHPMLGNPQEDYIFDIDNVMYKIHKKYKKRNT